MVKGKKQNEFFDFLPSIEKNIQVPKKPFLDISSTNNYVEPIWFDHNFVAKIVYKYRKDIYKQSRTKKSMDILISLSICENYVIKEISNIKKIDKVSKYVYKEMSNIIFIKREELSDFFKLFIYDQTVCELVLILLKEEDIQFLVNCNCFTELYKEDKSLMSKLIPDPDNCSLIKNLTYRYYSLIKPCISEYFKKTTKYYEVRIQNIGWKSKKFYFTVHELISNSEIVLNIFYAEIRYEDNQEEVILIDEEEIYDDIQEGESEEDIKYLYITYNSINLSPFFPGYLDLFVKTIKSFAKDHGCKYIVLRCNMYVYHLIKFFRVGFKLHLEEYGLEGLFIDFVKYKNNDFEPNNSFYKMHPGPFIYTSKCKNYFEQIFKGTNRTNSDIITQNKISLYIDLREKDRKEKLLGYRIVSFLFVLGFLFIIFYFILSLL